MLDRRTPLPQSWAVKRRTLKHHIHARSEQFHHHVYVVLLAEAVARHRRILAENPERDPAKPCVYVGMSGLNPEARFANHKSGYKSAWVVRRYGVRLLPELYAHLNPMPFEAAAVMEQDLRLRSCVSRDIRSQADIDL